MKISEIAEKIGGKFNGQGDLDVVGVASLSDAEPNEISFLANPKYAALAAKTNAAAVLVGEDWSDECPAILIRVENPDAAFAQVASLFYTPVPRADKGVHPSAVVAENVKLGEGVSIGAHCVIEPGVQVGSNTVISPQSYIGHNAVIGSDCFLYPQVSLREDVCIGNRVIIHNGTVVGSDGFGYSVDSEGIRSKIPQIGTVQIGDDVEIGANVTIDRARFGKTRIGNGVKIDNLVQIAHNAVIGDHSVIIAQVAIAGSATLGKRVIMAGQSAVAGHLKIGDGAVVAGKAGVTKDVAPGEYVMGMPAASAAKYKKNLAAVMFYPKLKKRIMDLEKKVSELLAKSL